MIHYIVPSEKNNQRAILLSRPFLIIYVLVVFLFNFGVGINIPIYANDSTSAISIENLLEKHNDERKETGISELKLNAALSQSAQKKAQTMLELNCWNHYCPEGRSPWELFLEVGYDYVFAGENLAEGFYDIDSVMEAWENSPSHKENLLRKEYSEVGFGIAYGDYQGNPNNIVIVVHFGTQKNVVQVANQDGELVITNPKTGGIFRTSEVEVLGNTTGFDQVFVVKDGVFQGLSTVALGIFTYNLSGLNDGAHEVYALGFLDNGAQKKSNVVNFDVNLSSVAGSIAQTEARNNASFENSSFLGFSIKPSQKNIVNFAFVAALAALFLIDFIVLSKTEVLHGKKSYSHFNFVILAVVALIIISGGFSGHIGTGLAG